MRQNGIAVLLGISILLNVILLGALLWMREQVNPTAVALQSEAPPVTLMAPPATATLTRAPSATPTTAPSATPTPEPTATVTASPPTDTSTPTPTSAPSPTPTPQPTATASVAGPGWLQYANRFRAQAGLPLLVEDVELSNASALHSQYMVYTGQISHSQDPANPYFTRLGNQAAANSNLAAGDPGVPSFEWAFNYWISAPFHGLPLLDPQLRQVGFGAHRDAFGALQSTAALDVKSGLGALPQDVEYPIMFPGDGGETWILRYSLPEFPFALDSCFGYRQPSGPPIILQIGPGDRTPDVAGTSLKTGDVELAHCYFDETNYLSADPYFQRSGRTILNERDAIVIMPRDPLEPGKTYTVRVDANGESYVWSFRTVDAPRPSTTQ